MDCRYSKVCIIHIYDILLNDKIGEVVIIVKRFLIFIIILIILLLACGGYTALEIKSTMKHLFKMNKLRQEQGYYTAEFEFKLLGIAYCLDKGDYKKGIFLIKKLTNEMETTEGMIKVPKFDNPEDELNFYLELQNPVTGAFMDDAYPYSSYHGPTENILIYLDKLARKINKPLRLKYPLRYLDQINTPETLIRYLDDIGTVGFLASKFPQTTFHNTRDMVNLIAEVETSDEDEDLVIQRNGLYKFTPEWKEAMLKWFYDYQDPATGLWGPKSKSGKLRKKDLSNTASIVKAFVDNEGNNKHPDYPLRYRHELINSAMEKMSADVPRDEDIERVHEWDLVMSKTIKMLARYLMKYADVEDKEKIRDRVKEYINVKFEKYYKRDEGAFSHYAGEGKATLDGSAFFFIFWDIGAYSLVKQRDLWGIDIKDIGNAGTYEITESNISDINKLLESVGGNSVRFYSGTQEIRDLTSDVVLLGYLPSAEVPDIMELTYRMRRWLDSTELTMGNWVAKADLQERMEEIDTVGMMPAENLPEQVYDILINDKGLTAVVFDQMQLPIHKMILTGGLK